MILTKCPGCGNSKGARVDVRQNTLICSYCELQTIISSKEEMDKIVDDGLLVLPPETIHDRRPFLYVFYPNRNGSRDDLEKTGKQGFLVSEDLQLLKAAVTDLWVDWIQDGDVFNGYVGRKYIGYIGLSTMRLIK